MKQVKEQKDLAKFFQRAVNMVKNWPEELVRIRNNGVQQRGDRIEKPVPEEPRIHQPWTSLQNLASTSALGRREPPQRFAGRVFVTITQAR